MSAAIHSNAITVLDRVKGDLDPIPFQLLGNDGEPIDLAGKTLQMRLVKLSDGTIKLAAGSCTITAAAEGQGYYLPVAADVDTAADYAVYVLDVVAGGATPDPRYPFDGPKYILRIVNEHGGQS